MNEEYKLSESEMQQEITLTWTLKECASVARIMLSAGLLLRAGDAHSHTAGKKLLTALINSNPTLKAEFEQTVADGKRSTML